MVCLMITVAVTTTDVELWRFAQAQKSNLGRLIGRLYRRPLRAGPCAGRRPGGVRMRSIVRKAIGTLASNRAMQSWRFLSGTILKYILEFISKLTIYEYIALEIFFCLVDFGTIALLIVLAQTYKQTPVV